MSDLDLLRNLRLLELDAALEHFPQPVGREVRVLELGAGAGWQANRLEQLGYRVSAIDVAHSAYREDRVFPVQTYDGRELPFDDRTFDVVFSSNVLEHIGNLDAFLAETARVLAAGGIVVHILPTPVWRIWSSLLHPLWIVKRGLLIVLRSGQGRGTMASGGEIAGAGFTKKWLKRLANLAPHRHGERGNIWTEACYFSRKFWLPRFRRSGFNVLHVDGAGLFYTECEIFGAALPVSARKRLAGMIGSTCDIYCLTAA